jgi:type I restriction enzyme S subunit
VRLIDLLVKLTDGTHHSPPNLAQGDFKYITAKNIKSDGVSLEGVTYISKDVHHEIYARCNPERGDILYIKDGATTGVVTINNLDEPFSLLSSVALLKVSRAVSNRLLVEFLRSPFFYMQMRGFMKGAAITRVTLKRMAPAILPLPPTAEQHRIIAKVDELMALCDQLEATREKREKQRDRLTAASLHHLNNGANATVFREHAHFYLDHLPRLTTRPNQIPALRQAILSLAVQGKLVLQNPDDQSAASTATTSAARSHVRGIQDNVTGESWPNELPSSWRWHRLETISEQITDGEHATPPRIHEQQVPLVTAKNVRDGSMDYGNTDWVSHETAVKAWKRCRPSVGDVLLVCVGATTGRLCVLREPRDMVLVRSVALIRPTSAVEVDYLALVLRSPLSQAQIWEKVKVTAQPCLYINRIKSLLIPLPPFAEQHRIVTKVDELMGLCDRLEAELTTTQTESRRLLEAVLHQALAVTE